MATRRRSTVSCLRAEVDSRKPASCSSEYERALRDRCLLDFPFIVFLHPTIGRWKDLVEGDVASVRFSLLLHLHHVHDIIELLYLDPCLPCVNHISLGFKEFCLFCVGRSPCQGCPHFLVVLDEIWTPKTKRAIIPAWAKPWASAVAKRRWVKRLPPLVDHSQILIHPFQVTRRRRCHHEGAIMFLLLIEILADEGEALILGHLKVVIR